MTEPTIPQSDDDDNSTLEFLRELYPRDAPGWLTLWVRQTKRTQWVGARDLEAAAAWAYQHSRQDDVYFGVGLRRERLAPDKRGTAEDVIAIPGLWTDIDLKSPAHKTTNLPPTIDEARTMVRETLPPHLAPSIEIHSGHGLHVYWLFKELWSFADEEDRQRAARLLQRLQATIQAVAQRRGWHVDSTFDLARILRPPGTLNHKAAPIPVRVLDARPTLRYHPTEFEPSLIDLDPEVFGPLTVDMLPEDLPQIDIPALKVSRRIKDLIRLGDDPDCPERYPSRSEGEFAVIQALINAGYDDPTIAGILLNPDNQIADKPRERGRQWLEQEIARARGKRRCTTSSPKAPKVQAVEVELLRPHSALSQKLVGQIMDPGTGELHINTREGDAKLAKARTIVSNLADRAKVDPGIVFSSEMVEALALLQHKDPAEWARLRVGLQKIRISMRDVERALKTHRRGATQQTTSEPPEPQTAGQQLLDCPAPDLIVPQPYFLRGHATGFIATSVDENTGEREETKRIIAYAPVLITGRFHDADEGTESLQLTWRRREGWRDIVVDRGIALDSKRLIERASEGFPVARDNTRELSRYLHVFEAVNYSRLPQARVSSHLGWQGRQGEAGFLWGRTFLFPNGITTVAVNLNELPPDRWQREWIAFRGLTPGDEQIAEAYHAAGTLDGWVSAVHALSEYPRVLLALYTSFVPPLLRILQAPNFVVDWAHRTSTGKTTGLRVAASVWGKPDERAPDGALATWMPLASGSSGRAACSPGSR